MANFNIRGSVSFDEPLSGHTSFRVGGPADAYVVPEDAAEITVVLRAAARERIPVFVLGGGANILVSDAGIRGVVLDLSRIRHIDLREGELIVGAGYPMSDAAAWAAARGASGPDFLYSMPGSVGGSVWMNARCYGTSVSDILRWVTLVDAAQGRHRYVPPADEFAYKKSPFQTRRSVIFEACFSVKEEEPETIAARMREIEADRRAKGHFDAPSAGSVFKNNRAFGKPTGRIIDELGLKGHRIGGARISPLHGNIILNTGTATAADILALIRHVETTVEEATGFRLEREVMPVGSWPE